MHRRTATDEDMAEPVADAAQLVAHRTVPPQEKEKKISGTVLPGNGGLIGVERVFDL